MDVGDFGWDAQDLVGVVMIFFGFGDVARTFVISVGCLAIWCGFGLAWIFKSWP